MRIVYCGRLQDAAGKREVEVHPPAGVATVFALRDWLSRDDADLAAALASNRVRIVVNDALVPGDAPLSADDEIAFMPPVSGG